MTGFRIARAESRQDIAAAVALFEAYARSIGIDLSYQGFEAEMAAMPGKYAPPAGALLIARDARDDAVGCAALRPLERGICEMKRLYVAPAGRGLGLGKALAEAVIDEARRIGYREIRLDTLPTMNAAIGLYEALGFSRIAPYYETPVAGTLFLAKPL
ncbi:GNAT family N-acetyltransferase [Rhizobium herbae]